MHTMANLFSDLERYHEDLRREARLLRLNYFRSNEDERSADVRYSGYSKVNANNSETDGYIQHHETATMLSLCALRVLNGWVLFRS